MFSLISAWTNGWANNCDAGHLRPHRAHCSVTVLYKTAHLSRQLLNEQFFTFINSTILGIYSALTPTRNRQPRFSYPKLSVLVNYHDTGLASWFSRLIPRMINEQGQRRHHLYLVQYLPPAVIWQRLLGKGGWYFWTNICLDK